MKKHLYIFAIAALALVLNACGPTYVVQQPAPPQPAPVADPLPPPPPEPQPEASYQSFYDDLSPYGQWINDPRYGYVWLPNVGPDFKPYATNGHWVYTEEGWTWASDYNWGWATFHYGRWFFQDGFGWMWVPGNEYAPAWVTWRNSDDYYGWAPMGPGVSFDMAYSGGYVPPPHYWCFVPHQYVGSPYARNYYVNESRNVTIINHTTVINHITVVNNNNYNYTRNVNYGRGPDPEEVGRYSGTALRPMPVRTSNRPMPGGQINNGGLSVYRPRIYEAPQNNNGNMGAPSRMAPARVSNLNDARPQNTAVYGSRPANTGFPNRDNDPVNARPGSGYDRGNEKDRGNHYGEQRRDQAQPQTQPQGQPQTQQPATQQPAGQPGSRPFGWGRPGNQGGQPQSQPQGQPQFQQPVNNSPATQPVNNQPAGQPVTNDRPAFHSIGGQQTEITPINRRAFGPPQQPVTQQPAVQQSQPVNSRPGGQPQGQPNNRPVMQAPANNPSGAQPQGQPVRSFVMPSHPAAQQQRNQVQAPAVQSRPVSRPVTPPPPPQKQDDKKDTRPVSKQ